MLKERQGGSVPVKLQLALSSSSDASRTGSQREEGETEVSEGGEEARLSTLFQMCLFTLILSTLTLNRIR